MTDRFAIIDLEADIRRSDLFSFSTRDYRKAWALKDGCDGAVKRFIGVDPDAGILECDCTNPPYTIHTGTTNLLYAYRVRATAPTRQIAVRLLRAVRRDAEAFDVPLVL